MKRKIVLVSAVVILLLFIGISALYTWMYKSVLDNIEIVKSQYSGTAEEALIAFLKDEQTKMIDKTHIAIWTLGQIKSERALPILKELYKDDPEGETCYGNHDQMICQYEIFKAIEAIEGKTIFSFAYLNK